MLPGWRDYEKDNIPVTPDNPWRERKKRVGKGKGRKWVWTMEEGERDRKGQ